MSYWLNFYQVLLRFLQRVLYLWVQPKILTAPDPVLHQAHDTNICYVLRTKSLADSLVLDRECRNLDLHRPFDALSIPGTLEEQSLSFLINPEISPFKRMVKRKKAERIKRLFQSVQMHPDLEVLLVPVTIFWGRSPDKENSLWKIMFADTWSIPGSFRKFLMILLHGRQTFVQFDEPLSLQNFLRSHEEKYTTDKSAETLEDKELNTAPNMDALSNEALEQELNEQLDEQFQKQREAVIGPDLSHRRLLVQSLLDAKRVKNVIHQQAENSGSDIKKIERKALKYADEIASDYSYAVIRIYHRVLTWLWNNLYDGVKVYHTEQLQSIAKHYEIIYVPSHRSHIDYLLLSYVLYGNGLVPPHIAAGVNLNLPIIGPFLRRGGAFFIRRSFKDNPLYAAVFDEYLHTVLSRGFSIEYFIEGGRSRTGRLLSPRTGMLSMTLKSFIRNSSKPIAFIPVYIGYERVFEGASYVGELKGKKKEKESLRSFIQSVRRIRRQFGKVHVSFSQPIYLKGFLDKIHADWRTMDLDLESSNDLVRVLSSQLAEAINTHINNAAAVHAISLLSTIILSTPKQAIDEGVLLSQLDLYLSLLNRLKYAEHQIQITESTEEVIEYGEKMGIIKRKKHTLGDVFYCNEHQAILLSYLRNNTLHVFALPSLIALLISNNPGIALAQINSIVYAIYPFLKTELFLQPTDRETLTCQIHKICEFLAENQLIIMDETASNFKCPDPGSELFVKLTILATCIRPALERYYIVLAILKRFGSGALTAKELENLGHLMAERMSLLHQFNAPEHFDRKLFRNFLDSLLNLGLIREAPESKQIIFEDSFIELIDQAQYVLSTDLRHTILQITEDGSTKFDAEE